jgi:hypothetical protein
MLEQMVARREVGSLVIAVNPMYDNLRTDQRLKDLIGRVLRT